MTDDRGMDGWDRFFAALERWLGRIVLGSFVVAILMLWILTAVLVTP